MGIIMYNYITKPNKLRISQIRANEFALSPFNYRKVISQNTNVKLVSELLLSNDKGFEPGSKNYINFSNNFFIRISELSDEYYTFDISDATNKIIPPKTKQEKVSKYDLLYQTASNVGNVGFYIGSEEAYFNSHLRKIDLKDKFYCAVLLKSNFGRQQVDVLGSIKGVDNFREEYLLNTAIPYPTKKNNPNPNDIIKYVSLLMQSIIDKEENLKNKNEIIDKLILEELKNNQSADKFKFAFPKISEIKKEYRTDTILYTDKYKRLEYLVTNYKNGFFNIPETSIRPGKTPEDYFYTNYKAENTFEWVTPKNLSQRRLIFKTYIHTKQNTVTKKYSLIFSGIRYVGNCFFVENDEEPIYCNQNTLVINYSNKIEEQLYILCYFSSQIGKKLQLMQRVFGIVPILYSKDFAKIPIPKIPIEIQKAISKEYYNSIDPNKGLTLENYIDKEKARNLKLGIFQLNTEILELKEKLAMLVDKIVNEKPIIIEL
jgi:restriction endonuclease S subunit